MRNSFNRAQLRRRDRRIDAILEDGPRYVKEARERAKEEIVEDLRRRHTV